MDCLIAFASHDSISIGIFREWPPKEEQWKQI